MSRQIRGADRFGADHVGLRREQWTRELPDLDTVGMAVLGRARWITLKVRPAIEAIFDRHGLDTGEFDVVATLLRSGPPYRLRPTELYRSLMISSGGLTNRLARLEKAGLVRRAESGSDARSLPVELTGKGRATAEAAIRADMECEATLLAGLSSEEQEALGRLLSKLALSLDRCGGSESA